MSEKNNKCIKVFLIHQIKSSLAFVTAALNTDHAIHIVGKIVEQGRVLDAIRQTDPDILILNIKAPSPFLLALIQAIMQSQPRPILVCFDDKFIGDGDFFTHASNAGVLAVLTGTQDLYGTQFTDAAKRLVDAIRLMSEIKVVKRWIVPSLQPVQSENRLLLNFSARKFEIVGIGASTGGPKALQSLLSNLPKNFSLPILIVQHMTPGFTYDFADWLMQFTNLPTRVAKDGEIILGGHIYIAPDDCHLGVSSRHRIQLQRQQDPNEICPSVSFLFQSLALVYKENAVGVLMTGMGADGVNELKTLRELGALTIAQNADSSVIHGMPGQAIKIGAAQYVLPPDHIATLLESIKA